MAACPKMFARQNLEIYQGDDFAVAVQVLGADGLPADLTGYTALAQIRFDVADKDFEVACEIATVVDIENSQVNLSIHHDVTTLLTEGRYVWDMQLTSPTDVVTTVIAGSVSVVLEVSRPVVIGHATGLRRAR